MNPWCSFLLFILMVATAAVVVGTLAIYGLICLIYRRVNKKPLPDKKSDRGSRKEVQ